MEFAVDKFTTKLIYTYISVFESCELAAVVISAL